MTDADMEAIVLVCRKRDVCEEGTNKLLDVLKEELITRVDRGELKATWRWEN